MEAAGLRLVELSERPVDRTGCVSIGTMHLAKGLEFEAVAVITCDDEVLPSAERIDSVVEESDLEDVYETELRGPRPGPRPAAGERGEGGVRVPGGFPLVGCLASVEEAQASQVIRFKI